MSIIKFFGLGGSGENGKNLYIVEVGEKIFILDAGLKYPSLDLYGIDAVIPDFDYLISNKERIQGIFLSHGHMEHIGAIAELLKAVNIKVFGTHFTISLVEGLLQDAGLDLKDFRLYRINETKVLNFGDVKVEFYNVTHSIPEAIHIVIDTPDGALVYAPDFCFDPSMNKLYKTSFGRISDIAKAGVLALASESLGVVNINRMQNNDKLDYYLSTALDMPQRFICTVYASDIAKLQRVVDLCVEAKRRVAILGIKAQRCVNVAIANNYLKIPEGTLVSLKFMTEENKNEDRDLAVIVAGKRHEPFFMLQRMCRQLDKLIAINSSDVVCLLTPPVAGSEKLAARTMDELYQIGASVFEFKKTLIPTTHADKEDLKMLYNMLNPKYIIPVIGEYRHLYQQKKLLRDYGYRDEDIVMLKSGEVGVFVDGKYEGIKEHTTVSDRLIDGLIVGDLNAYVLKDRFHLSQDGALCIAVVLDSKKRKIVCAPEVSFKGFMLDVADICKEIVTLLIDNLNTMLEHRYFDINTANKVLTEKITKKTEKLSQKQPVVSLTLIDLGKDEL